MLRVPNPPPEDIFQISLTSLKAFLVDLPPGAMKGMRQEQDGWEGVVHEVASNQATYGERAGITATDFTRFKALNGQHAQIFAQLPQVEKAREVLTESLAHVDNLRHRLAATFADAAEAHAKAEGGNPTLRTAYEKTIAYRGVIADKAVKTRRRNEEAKKGQGGATGTSEADAATGATGTTGTTGTTDATEKAGSPGKTAQGMARVPNAPPEDIFQIDLAPLKAFLVDLPPGATKGMRQEQDGWEGVVHEIISNQEKYGDRAGITATDFTRFKALNSQHAQILAQLPQVEKAVEVLTESLAHVDNLRHRLATNFADAAEAHARVEGGDPTLRTAYEKTIAYRAVIADKAVKARKKNEEAKKGQGGATGGSGGTGTGETP